MFDRSKVEDLLIALGAALLRPTRLTVVGSAAAMINGQDERQTPDIDIWHPTSDYDVTEMKKACISTGLLYDPTGYISGDEIYLQILRPGITMFPKDIEVTEIGRYGNLSVDMPPPSMIIATKLARASDSDIEDVAWWISNFDIRIEDIQKSISRIPQSINRESARENIIFAEMAISKKDSDFEP